MAAHELLNTRNVRSTNYRGIRRQALDGAQSHSISGFYDSGSLALSAEMI